MKKNLIALVVLLNSFLISVDAQKTPFLTQPFSNVNISEVFSRTQGGNIDVEGGNQSDSRVEMFITANGNNIVSISKEEIQQRLNEYYSLDISATGRKLTVTAKVKEKNINWKKGLSISFKIYVQQGSSTDLATSGGSIVLTNLAGRQDFATSGGDLTVKQVSGNLRGHTSGGSITVSDSKDDIDLETSGGSIHAENCSGKLTLGTSGGSIHLAKLKGTIRATTSGGNVGGSNVDGELFAHTSGGNIDLQEIAGNLEASTSGGHISADLVSLKDFVRLQGSGGNISIQVPANKGLDLKLSGDKIKTGNLQGFNGSIDDHSVNGKLNGGGTAITVDAGNGKVSLTLK